MRRPVSLNSQLKVLWETRNTGSSEGGDSVAVPGEPGPEGPPGPQGEPGPKGDKGDAGDLGPQGNPGTSGAPGPKGDAGATGPKGDPGLTGQQGIPGERGAQGDAGAVGPKGEAGTPGATGPKGDPGEQGIQGVQGPQGNTGLKGDKGDQGIQGLQGVKGDTGLTGPASTVPGPQGIPGVKGDTGDVGLQGIQGPQGIPGPSADPWVWAKLTADRTNSTVTLAAAKDLSFTATANTTYIVYLVGSFTAAATTTGIAVALDIPSGSVSGQAYHPISATASGSIEQIADNATTGATTGVRAAATVVPIGAEWIVAVGATGGTVQLMFRSEIAASAVVMKAGISALGRRAI